eukprot:537830_1
MRHSRYLQLILLLPLTALAYQYILAPFIKYNIESIAFRPPPKSPKHKYSNLNHFMIGSSSPKISAMYIEYPVSKLTVIYSHGTGDDLTVIAHHMQRIHDVFKVNVIAYDYSGYGLSDGQRSEENVYNDIQIIFNHCIDRLKLSPKSIVLWGQSLGSAPTIHLAAHHTVGAMIIQSGFYSVLSMYLPQYIAWMLQTIDVFDNKQNLNKIKCPCLVAHGESDHVIPFTHAQQMAAILHDTTPNIVYTTWLKMDHEWRGIIDSKPAFRQSVQDLLNQVASELF